MRSLSFFLFSTLLFLPFTVHGAGFGNGDYHPLPDTGQTRCYDVAGNEITCPSPGDALYGQDGNYQGTQKSFTAQTINGDDVVLDNNTKLMWQQADDGTTRNWQAAMDYCAALDHAGYTDWRLPEIFELTTLVDYSIPYPGPIIDTSVFSCRSSYYWSATTSACCTDHAWGVDFYVGYYHWYTKTSTFYVRCVHGGL